MNLGQQGKQGGNSSFSYLFLCKITIGNFCRQSNEILIASLSCLRVTTCIEDLQEHMSWKSSWRMKVGIRLFCCDRVDEINFPEGAILASDTKGIFWLSVVCSQGGQASRSPCQIAAKRPLALITSCHELIIRCLRLLGKLQQS